MKAQTLQCLTYFNSPLLSKQIYHTDVITDISVVLTFSFTSKQSSLVNLVKLLSYLNLLGKENETVKLLPKLSDI